MKTGAANDLEGRLVRCAQRARMIGHSLEGIASSDRFEVNDRVTLPAEVIIGMAYAADELADECMAVLAKYIDEDNATLREKKR